MPGFDKSRFVTLTDEEYEDIKCGICLGVFNNPLVTQCCRQSFCFDCINQWIKNSKTCPNCRKGLTKIKLIPPPRFSSNFIEKLDIYCDYKEMGCNQGLKLGQLGQHLKSCAFNPINKCSVCSEVKVEGHNCVQKLETIVVGLKEQIESLKTRNKGLEEEVKQLTKSNTKLRANLRRKETKNTDLQKKFDEELKVKCDENQNLCSTVSRFESEIIGFKQEIESLRKEINDFNDQNKNFFADNQKLKNENKDLREYCDKYLNEKENNESLRQELAKVSEENKLINEQNINALNELQKLKEENEELRRHQLNVIFIHILNRFLIFFKCLLRSFITFKTYIKTFTLYLSKFQIVF
jgi:regulator of replication initiation timing